MVAIDLWYANEDINRGSSVSPQDGHLGTSVSDTLLDKILIFWRHVEQKNSYIGMAIVQSISGVDSVAVAPTGLSGSSPLSILSTISSYSGATDSP